MIATLTMSAGEDSYIAMFTDHNCFISKICSLCHDGKGFKRIFYLWTVSDCQVHCQTTKIIS